MRKFMISAKYVVPLLLFFVLIQMAAYAIENNRRDLIEPVRLGFYITMMLTVLLHLLSLENLGKVMMEQSKRLDYFVSNAGTPLRPNYFKPGTVVKVLEQHHSHIAPCWIYVFTVNGEPERLLVCMDDEICEKGPEPTTHIRFEGDGDNRRVIAMSISPDAEELIKRYPLS